MKRLRPIRRTILRTLLVLLVFFLLVAGAQPVWLPWLLKPLAQRAGVSYQTYERLGYHRCVLSGVSARFGRSRLNAQRVEMALPPAWLWRAIVRGTPQEPCVQVSGWRLELATGLSQAGTEINSARSLLEAIDARSNEGRRWLPGARLANGVIHMGERTILVPSASWNSGVLTATVKSPDLTPYLVLHGRFVTPGEMVLEADIGAVDVRGRVVLKRQTTRWATIGEISWRTNRLSLSAQLGHTGWWPEEAELTGASLRFPADLLGLRGYSSLTGALTLNWRTNRFSLALHTAATPEKPDLPQTPPWELTAGAHGNTTSIVLDRLLVTTPSARGELAAPTGFDWQTREVPSLVNLRLGLDLAQLKLARANGQLAGALRLRTRGVNVPSLEADLRGTNVSVGGVSIRSAVLAARLDWPWLVLEQGRFDFGDDSLFQANGSLDLSSQRLTNTQWQLTGRPLREWLPPNLGFATLRATGQLSGPLTHPRHGGAATVGGLRAPGLRPCALEVAWEGEGLRIARTDLSLSTGGAELRARGSWRALRVDGRQLEGTLERLDWRRQGTVVYDLEQPCPWIASQNPHRSPPEAWQVRLAPLRWRARDSTVELSGVSTWPRSGEAQIHARNLAFDEFRDLFDLPIGAASVEKLDLETHWSDGPLKFKLGVTGGFSWPDDTPWSVEASLDGDAQGINLRPLTVRTKLSTGLTIAGHVPWSLAPTNSGLRAQFNSEEPFSLQATNSALARHAQSLGKWGVLTVEEPKFTLALAGNLNKPKGEVRLQIQRLDWVPRTNTAFAPRLEQLQLHARLEREGVKVVAFSLLLDGQPVSATGELPLQNGFWTCFLQDGALPDWTRSRGQVTAKDFALTALTDHLPGQVITEGRCDLALAWEPGPMIQGHATVSHAATRPFEPLGPIRDLNLTLEMKNRAVTMENLVAQVAGAPITGTGSVSFDDPFQPRFQCALRGTNVPLARALGLIVRGDVDLRLSSAGARPLVLSGQLVLRDSLYLQDLEWLAPAPEAQAGERPTRWRIAEKPFKDWTLDVKVSGDEFLRVRTPVFTGLVSANFHLENNLGNPLPIGEASIASGRITFPFGTLRVDNGFIYLSREAPQRPRLAVNASGTCYGYAIKVEITGSSAAPQLLFTSTPPLGSSQILSLLTSGQLPGDPGVLDRTARAERLALFLGNDVVSRFLGNEPLRERLTVNSGQRISQSGKATYAVEYHLTDRWSLVGEYDQFDTLNAHVKWKLYSK